MLTTTRTRIIRTASCIGTIDFSDFKFEGRGSKLPGGWSVWSVELILATERRLRGCDTFIFTAYSYTPPTVTCNRRVSTSLYAQPQDSLTHSKYSNELPTRLVLHLGRVYDTGIQLQERTTLSVRTLHVQCLLPHLYVYSRCVRLSPRIVARCKDERTWSPIPIPHR